MEVINYLKDKTDSELCWVVPGHKDKSDNNDDSITCVAGFVEALEKIGAL